jgi:hypothetical protein
VNLDELRADFLELMRKFHELEERIDKSIAEYRQTVNRTLILLSEDIDRNRQLRLKRQKWQDYKDVAIGCLILLTLLTGCSIIGTLIYLITSGRVVSV